MKAPWKRDPNVPKSQSLDDLPDHQLVEMAKTDQEAFGMLYERYVGKIYNYVYYRTGNHHDAEDLTAMVFYRAMRHIPAYTERGVPFQAWLYRIAHNLIANWHRDRARRKIIPLEEFTGPGPDADKPDEQAEGRAEHAALLEVIRRLPEERQQLLILKFIERLPNAEIGVIMGRTEGAIKSLYHRTLIALRDELGWQTGSTLQPTLEENE
jgi:RNA polymerase sigma-70 factor (ECF subfamily)